MKKAKHGGNTMPEINKDEKEPSKDKEDINKTAQQDDLNKEKKKEDAEMQEDNEGEERTELAQLQEAVSGIGARVDKLENVIEALVEEEEPEGAEMQDDEEKEKKKEDEEEKKKAEQSKDKSMIAKMYKEIKEMKVEFAKLTKTGSRKTNMSESKPYSDEDISVINYIKEYERIE